MSLALVRYDINISMEDSSKLEVLGAFVCALVFAFMVTYVARHSTDNVIEEVDTSAPALNLNLG